MVSKRTQNRRTFLKASAGAILAGTSVPYFLSQPQTLAAQTTSKNDRFAIGLIGAGGMGCGNMKSAS